jgi:flagellar biosynthetic protein FliR
MFIPAIGETNVPPNIRLVIAIAVSLLISSASFGSINMPSSPLMLTIILAQEITVGIILGLSTKILLSAIHVFGLSIASQSGLASAMLFDPSQGTQGSLFGNLFTYLVIALILSMDLHLVIISGLANTYNFFPVNSFAEHYEDFIDVIVKITSGAFTTGIKMSFPFIISGLLLAISAGILSKLMPQLQIFYLLLPVQIILAIIMLLLTFSSLTMWYIDYFSDHLNQLFGI